MKLFDFFRRKPKPEAIARPIVKLFFNGPGCITVSSEHVRIPEKGEYVFCWIGGCQRWVVQGIRTDARALYPHGLPWRVEITEITVVLDPADEQ